MITKKEIERRVNLYYRDIRYDRVVFYDELGDGEQLDVSGG